MQPIILAIALEWLALNGGPAVDVSESLGSPRFKVRQQAAKALEAAWPYSDASLRRTAETGADVEAAETARTIRERCWDRCVKDAPWADFPLWDAYAKTWNGSRFPALSRAIGRNLPYAAGYPWENYREVSRRWALQALRKGWTTPTLVRLWFRCGRAVDAEYERLHAPQRMPVGSGGIN